MDHRVLKHNIVVNTVLDGMSDADVAAWYNVKGEDTVEPVPVSVYESFLHQTGVWLKLYLASVNAGVPDMVKGVCILAMEIGKAKYDNVHLHLPIVNQMAFILVSSTVLSQAEADGILNLKKGKRSKWEVLHQYDELITDNDVLIARSVDLG